MGKVVSSGPGRLHADSGELIPNPFSPGETVVYGKYDGTEVQYEGTKHMLIRSGDVLVKFPAGKEMTLDNVQMTFDQCLLKVEKVTEETSSGLLLASSAVSSTRPSVGEVIKVGPGRFAANGNRIEMEVAVGDIVKFRDFAGNEVTVEGEDYAVVKTGECLAKY